MPNESDTPLTNCSVVQSNDSVQETVTSVPCPFYDVTTTSTTDAATNAIMMSMSTPSSFPETSSASFNSGTTSPNCVCYIETSNLTVQERIERLISDLKVDTKNTTLSRMKKISAPDHRPSAKTIGAVGVVALVMVFGGIIVLDLERLRTDVSNAVDKIKNLPMC